MHRRASDRSGEASSSSPLLDWDKNLDGLKTALVPAGSAAGTTYWRLIRAAYDGTIQGRSNVFCEVQDEKGERLLGQRVVLSWPGGSGHAITENKPAPELACNFAIGGNYNPEHNAGPYTVGVDNLPSDKVSGIGRPNGRDATFYFTWRRSIAGRTLAHSVIRGMVIGGQDGQPVALRDGRGQVSQTKLDAGGAYIFGGLTAGVYAVEVGGSSVADLRVDGSSTLEAPVIDLRPRQSVIKGAVLTAAGQPAPNVTVILSSADLRRESVADRQGRFEFSGLLAGAYTVEAAGQVLTARVNGRDQATLDFRLPAEPARKPIAQYLLFGPPQQVGTRANLLLAEDYILRFMPTLGFSVDEAMNAAIVVIVGDVQAIGAADEERLKANGCQVKRLGGGPYAIEQAFAELLQGRGLSPARSSRLSGPTDDQDG